MNIATEGATAVPFDTARLDKCLADAGIDTLLATSKHNAQFLMGGYKFIFFAAMDAIGHSRYLPFVIYEAGRPDHACYVGNKMEGGEHANHPFWTPALHTATWGSLDAAALAAEHVIKIGKASPRIGIEPQFIPADAYALLREKLPGATFVDATGAMERMRAIKTNEELAMLRTASELITDSMQATIAWANEGSTKAEIIEQLRREETNRGLVFDYCLLTLGSSHNRAASSQAWKRGEVLSIDSGGNYHGYIGDLCRMGVLGEPDQELRDLLDEIEAVQQAAFSKVRAGALGGDVIAHAEGVAEGRPQCGLHRFLRAWHGADLARGAVPDDQPSGCL